jgi:hypothetical protein
MRILRNAMNLAYPRLRADAQVPLCDSNRHYAPGKPGVPFLVGLATPDGTVKIGVEINDAIRHPVVELQWKAGSSVRRAGSQVSWMPTWTQFRILHAQFSILPQCPNRRTFSKTVRIRSAKTSQ